MVDPQREKRWRSWLETISNDIFFVYFWRATWLTVGDMVRANPDVPPSHYFRYLSDTYGTSQAVAVRRIADESANVVSLVNLIRDVKRHAVQITTEWWLTVNPANEAGDFLRFRGRDSDHFDPVIANNDLARLHDAVTKVKKYVDQHLAHRDQDPTKDIPTFRDIHDAVDEVGGAFRTYNMLLTGADMPSLVPEPELDWYVPFTVPWLPPGSPPPILRGTFRGDPL
jgi:hypothetical protein